jgi:putative isomerase
MALRFNLEEMPSNDIAIAHGGSHAEACDRARVALQAPPMPKPADDDLSAARDILAWNTVWDTRNSRPYTACSRNWDLEKFGGFGVWLTDSAISALIHSSFDEEQAWENIAALLDAQTPEGNFPCLVTGNDNWRDRSQPPLVSLIIWLIYVRTGNIKLLELAYDPLKRNHAWWWRNRDGNANGVLEYGSSAAGEGLYMGTKLAAKNESLMDNSPVHDEAQWNDKSRTLDCEDVGLNSLITLDAEMLSFMAAALGRETEAGDHRARAAAHRSKLSTHFWDDARQIFANRLWSGKFVKSLAPTSFFPMIAGAATPSQERDLLRHLTNPRTFGGRFGLPSIARNDPAFSDNVYWRGRIWPILNWLVWLGLKRNNHWAAAESLRRKSLKLFAASWRSRLAPENFNAVTGEGLDQPDTDPFYGWTALLPLMGMAGVLDIDPWKGWCLNNTGNDIELGPVNTPIGSAHISRRQGWIEVTCAGKLVVASDVKPRLTHISIADRLAVMLPAGLARGRSIRLSRPIASASQNGRKLKGLTSTHEIRLEQTGHKPELLEITFL